MVSTSAPSKELAVPKSFGSVIGHAVFYTVLGFFVLLACYNLLTLTAIIPSIIWLLFYGYLLFDSCKGKGTRQFTIETLGSLAPHEFVWATTSNGLNEIQFGYRWFGRNFLYRKIPADQIETVRWGTGQASDRVGRDMNDWQVTVWFDHQEVYCLGP